MKKILSCFLSGVLLCLSAFAGPASITVLSEDSLPSTPNYLYLKRLEALDIITTDVETVTRGIAADAVARICFGDKASLGVSRPYPDVDADHPNIEGITAVSLLGYMVGDSQGMFRPDDPISFNELIKVLVSAVGYEHAAISAGGYPNGYLIVAAQNGMLPDAVSGTEFVDTAGFVHMLYTTLTIPVLEENISSENAYQVNRQHTLLDDILARRKMSFDSGIVISDGKAHLLGWSQVQENHCIIGDTVLRADIEMGNNIGMNVEYFYDNTYSPGRLTHIYPTEDNTVLFYESDDISNVTLTQYEFYNDSRVITKRLSRDLLVLYNGQGVEKGFSESDLMPSDGSVTLIDNNSDGLTDVVKVWNKTSYPIDRIGGDGFSIIYKQDPENPSSVKSLYVDKNDSNITYTVYDSQGNVISPEQIAAGGVASVGISKDGGTVTVIYNKNTISGTVEALLSNRKRNGVTVSGVEYYSVAVSNDKYRSWAVEPGDPVDLYLDENQRIVYIEAGERSSIVYAYIMSKSIESAIGGNVQFKAITAGNLGSVTHADWYWVQDKSVQNLGPFIYDLDTRSEINGTSYKVGSDSAAALNAIPLTNVVKLELSANGKVRSIENLEMNSDNYPKSITISEGKYRANTQGFVPDSDGAAKVSESDGRNFAISLSGNVRGLVLPQDPQAVYTEDAFLSVYRIGSDSTQWLEAYDIPEGSQTPRLIVLREKVLTESGTAYKKNFGIVNRNISQTQSDTGEIEYKLYYLGRGGGESNVIVRDDVAVTDVRSSIKELQIGDIISLERSDSEGKITRISAKIRAEDLILGAKPVNKLDMSVIWEQNAEMLFNIFYLNNNGTLWERAVSVDNTIFEMRTDRPGSPLNRIDVSEISAGAIGGDKIYVYESGSNGIAIVVR